MSSLRHPSPDEFELDDAMFNDSMFEQPFIADDDDNAGRPPV